MASLILSWPGLEREIIFHPDDQSPVRIAYNFVKHGVFHDARKWSPDAGPFMAGEPLYPALLTLALATVPSFFRTSSDCAHNPQCPEGAPVRERHRQTELAAVAVIVGATFLATLALTNRWPLALVMGTATLALFQSNVGGNALIGFLLLAHTVLARRMWKRPKLTTAAFAGLALSLAVLAEAVLQYYLIVLVALCAAGLWRERRRPLAGRLQGAVAVMLLAASLPAGLWMARNYAIAEQFTISAGRAGRILAIRAEHTQATWQEVAAMFAFFLPTRHVPGGSMVKGQLKDWLRPEDFGYTRIRGRYPTDLSFRLRFGSVFGNPMSHRKTDSIVVRRLDLLAPDWREKPLHERDLVARRVAVQLIRENWLKHLTVSVPMGLWGMDHRCRRYSGLHGVPVLPHIVTGVCGASKILSFTFIPTALVMLVLAARRRDVALALLALPAVYYYGIHTLATHFDPRLAQPALPLLMVVAALAWDEYTRRRAAKAGGPPGAGRAHPHPSPEPSDPRPAEGRPRPASGNPVRPGSLSLATENPPPGSLLQSVRATPLPQEGGRRWRQRDEEPRHGPNAVWQSRL